MKSQYNETLENIELLSRIARYFVIGCLLSVAVLHLVFMTQIGFMSDDYALMASAEKGRHLWNLHYSFLLEYLWKCTAAGSISALHWHLAVLLLHFSNVILLYFITYKRLMMSHLQSLFICACFAMNPAGVEALAWTCSAGYVLTIFWIFLAWNTFLQWNGQENEKHILRKGLYLAFLQCAAFLTWDWGILLLPVLFIFVLVKGNYFQNIKLLIPTFICWMIGALLRTFSHYESAWQYNHWTKKVSFLLGAPFLGLFPNLEKGLYQSEFGMIAFVGVIGFLLWAAYRNRVALAALMCFVVSVFPWVNGGNPSSRYFYLSMAFIYIVLAIGMAEIKPKPLAWCLGGVLLISQLIFTYERDVLWKMAFHQSQHLKEAAGLVVSKNTNNPLVIVNLPEAYGPEQMPMRPQVWYSGFYDLFPEVKIAKTSHCPYLWEKKSLMKRSEIPLAYPNALLYEVVYRKQNDWHEFALIPFNKSHCD